MERMFMKFASDAKQGRMGNADKNETQTILDVSETSWKQEINFNRDK